MRALLLLLLLLAACGGEEYSGVFDDAAVMGKAGAVHVAGIHARVRVRAGPPGRIEVLVRSPGKLPDAPVEFLGRGESVLVTLDPEVAKRAGTEIDVAAPGGMNLQVLGGDGDVDVSGSWRRLVVRTSNGAISARVDRADHGEMESHSGAVEFAASGSGPTGDFSAESIRGNVTVRVPASWSGQIKVASQTGKLDVPPHGNLRTLWEEDRKGLVGHVGAAPRKGAVLPSLWARSATGDVSFRLLE